MKSHDRWVEICTRCGLQSKGTAKTWIDGTRICGWCWDMLVEDLEFLQGKIYETRLLRVYPIIMNDYVRVKNAQDNPV